MKGLIKMNDGGGSSAKILKVILTVILIAVCAVIPQLRVLIVIIAAIAGKSVFGISSDSLRKRLGCGIIIVIAFAALYYITMNN